MKYILLAPIKIFLLMLLYPLMLTVLILDILYYIGLGKDEEVPILKFVYRWFDKIRKLGAPK